MNKETRGTLYLLAKHLNKEADKSTKLAEKEPRLHDIHLQTANTVNVLSNAIIFALKEEADK